MISAGLSGYQIMHRMVRKDLRAVLLDVITAGPGAAGGFDSVTCRGLAALYTLLLEHPVDHRGCCSSCRRPEAVVGRRRCRVYRVAQYWWQQPGAGLVSSLVREVGLIVPPPPVARPESAWPGLTITGRSAPDNPDGRAAPDDPHAPAFSPPSPPPGGFPGAGGPDPDHGGAGEPCPDHPRPRRGHPVPDDPALSESESLMLVTEGGAPCSA